MNKNTLIEGRTLKEWLENKELRCFAGWPEAVQKFTIENPESICALDSDLNMHYSPNRPDQRSKTAIYCFNPDYKWAEVWNGPVISSIDPKLGDFVYDNAWYDWQDYISCEAQYDLIFAGWKFKHNNTVVGWTQKRWGVSAEGVITSDCKVWKQPLIPIKIRFYRKFG